MTRVSLRFLISLWILGVCVLPLSLEAKRPVYASIVVDAHSGSIFHEHQADKITYPASLTKIMTLYLVFEALESGKIKFNRKFRVSARAAQQKPSKLGLKIGERISVKNAVMALMTKSANDVAVVVAEGLGKTEANFARQMTRKARKLGMRRTVFKNASGLPNKHQVTTARDMMKLSQALIKRYPRYYRYFKTQIFRYRGRSYCNHNKLLGHVKGVDGIKTGFINASGHNLSASAIRRGRRLIAVVMGGQTRNWRDRKMKRLLEQSFKKIRMVRYSIPKPKTRPTRGTILAQSSFVPVPALVPFIKRTKEEAYTPITQDEGWVVQVGAYARAKTAYLAATSAMRKTNLLKKAKVSIRVVPNRSRRIFRAQLMGFTKDQARRACKDLTSQGEACLVKASL